MDLFKFVSSESFLRIDGFIGNASPNGGFAAVDVAICTIEKANSLLNRLIEEENIFELGNPTNYFIFFRRVGLVTVLFLY